MPRRIISDRKRRFITRAIKLAKNTSQLKIAQRAGVSPTTVRNIRVRLGRYVPLSQRIALRRLQLKQDLRDLIQTNGPVTARGAYEFFRKQRKRHPCSIIRVLLKELELENVQVPPEHRQRELRKIHNLLVATKRQRALIQGIRQGKTLPQIAIALQVSHSTLLTDLYELQLRGQNIQPVKKPSSREIALAATESILQVNPTAGRKVIAKILGVKEGTAQAYIEGVLRKKREWKQKRKPPKSQYSREEISKQNAQIMALFEQGFGYRETALLLGLPANLVQNRMSALAKRSDYAQRKVLQGGKTRAQIEAEKEMVARLAHAGFTAWDIHNLTGMDFKTAQNRWDVVTGKKQLRKLARKFRVQEQ